jgi:hypothetical protein
LIGIIELYDYIVFLYNTGVDLDPNQEDDAMMKLMGFANFDTTKVLIDVFVPKKILLGLPVVPQVDHP